MNVEYLCAPEGFTPADRAALVIGHPGHELKIFGWISRQRPLVSILTDGSGRSGVSRISSSRLLLHNLAASQNDLFGVFSDAEFYRLLLARQSSLFLKIADQLATSFLEHEIKFVVADAAEGFNPAHDICRALADAAVAMVERKTGKTIANYSFLLAERTHCQPEIHDCNCLHVRLSDEALRQKLVAASEYAEMKFEVEAAIAKSGKESFQIECLRKNTERFATWPDGYKPYYEICGEQRTDAGAYERVIRYRDHILPIMEALRDHAARMGPVAA